MKFVVLIISVLLLCVGTAVADLQQGDKLPNPTLISADDGAEIQLHQLLNKITVIHLWKCD